MTFLKFSFPKEDINPENKDKLVPKDSSRKSKFACYYFDT